jgi:outer membrane protein assembly factor BamD (BamD/ComL family)
MPRGRSITSNRHWIPLALLTVFLLASPSAEAGPIARWLFGRDKDTFTGTPDNSDAQSTSLISRWMGNARSPFTTGSSMGDSSVVLGDKGWQKTRSAPDPATEAEFNTGKKLYDEGKLEEATKIFAAIAKREVKKVSPWGEKAQYYLAETYFKRQKFVDAESAYETLFAKYPGTVYRDALVSREYEIAQIWLKHENPKEKPFPWLAHFDGRLPVIDTDSYAVKALEHVYLHDPLGPLADDAMLRKADHYQIAKDYESASLFYDQLIVEYPKSPYLRRAQLSSIDAKMKGYIGPEYDASGLDQAREMIRRTSAAFPEDVEAAKDLSHTLDLITEQDAERNYQIARQYVRARKPTSAEFYYGMVMAKWPQSEWAKKSKVEIAALAKAPRKASVPSRIMTLPGTPDASSLGSSGGGNAASGLGGMGMGAGGGTGTSPY